jgi:hypothetical protein
MLFISFFSLVMFDKNHNICFFMLMQVPELRFQGVLGGQLVEQYLLAQPLLYSFAYLVLNVNPKT